MAIIKHIQTTWKIASLTDEGGTQKVAAFDSYVPPEIEQYIVNLDPDPRFCYVHAIAMTDGDYYGSNLNGDVFTTEELTGTQAPEEAAKNPGDVRGVQLPRFKTFEQAKFFRHHANSSTDKAYGDVPLAAWNAPMRRVELVIRIARKDMPALNMHGAPDIVAKFDRRGYLTLSMGTRIAYEKCRYCGHENELTSQRCDHLKNHMNEIMPDGRLVSAENYGCRFFDISDVTVPADPTAYTLSKVASATKVANPAADVFDYAGRDWRNKVSEIDKQISMLGTVADVDYCGTCEKTVDVPEFSIEEMKAAAVDGLPALLSTATLMGIVLSPVELVAATMAVEPEKVASARGDFHGFDYVPLDKFSPAAYNVLRSKIAERSGYVAPCLASGWEPAKIAANGYELAANYYAFYRAALGSLPVAQISKAAHRIPAVAELHRNGNPTNAAYHLAYAGIGV